MRRSALWTLVVVIVALVFVGLLVAMGGNDDENKTVEPTTTPPPPAASTPQTNPNTTTPPTTESQTGAAAVKINNFAFVEKEITIKKGTTVTWTNEDSVMHTVTPDSGEATAEFAGSGDLDNGDSYSVTFNIIGSYSYHCAPHPQMEGTVTVIE